MHLSESPADAMAAARRLPGAGAEATPKDLAVSMRKWCLVLHGDAALEYWKTDSRPSDGSAAWHGVAV